MAIETAIQPGKSGSQPDPITTHLAVTGMNCANCARHVTDAIQGVPGVLAAVVNLESQQAAVRWAAHASPNPPAVIEAIKIAGYGATIAEPSGSDHKAHGWQLNLWIGVVATVPMVIGEWVFQLGSAHWFQWLSFTLAGVVQVVAGARFYRGAWAQLKTGSSNMDTLVALGSTSAFAYSAWALLSGLGGHVYFMEAAAIITLISVGHWLESRVSARASRALRQLLNLAPAKALRRNADGAELLVPAGDLRPADVVVLRPGDHVPADGAVLEGHSTLDESMLTGESVPVEKSAPARLYAGTINLNGRLLMQVTATGEQTALARVIAAVQRAQSSRANIQRLGDRVSSVFVPLVVTVALAAALWWGLAPASARHVHDLLAQFLWPTHLAEAPLAAAVIVAASVLIIACPCAMGLATPAAIMAGTNAAARRGILIRDGVALEKAGQITAVLFDKTGTLTVGHPEVVNQTVLQPGADRIAAAAASPDQPRNHPNLVELAAALAEHSTHPISQAVARLALPASHSKFQFSDWQEIRGAGVQARCGAPASAGLEPPVAPELRLGSLRWLGESGVNLAPADDFAAEWSGQGATVVGLAADNSLAALFAVRDVLKPGAPAVVARLQRQGLKAYLITGDNPRAAASIARQAGIAPENVFAEVRPEQKAAMVQRLQQQGQRVAFVGDGINDAPALEQADLGIAVSRASDIAREAADIILLNSEIEAVPESLGLARATLRTIKQNLFWAFFYNAIGVPLAALGFISPVLCAVAMGVSDMVVLGNALRLQRYRDRGEGRG